MRLVTFLFLATTLTGPTLAQTGLDAWHADGQTWLVWDDDQTFAGAESWSIYRSSTPIVDVATAQLVAQTYPQDARGDRLGNADSAATWTVPDSSGVGTYTLSSTEALFVYTPRVAVDEYFAVVKTGAVALTPDNTVGPIAQTLDPVVPHVQISGVDAGHPFTLYSLWIDGDANENAGRPDHPVLGPASQRGQARLWCVFEPVSPLPLGPASTKVPATVFLHGGGGNYWNYRPDQSQDKLIDLVPTNGLYVTLDDRVYVRTPSTLPDTVMSTMTKWFGTCRSFDRFEPLDTLPPANDVVVDYSQRFIDHVFDWLVANRDVDVDRISMMGLSAGGFGVQLYARLRPDRVAAATAFVMASGLVIQPEGVALWGSPAQALDSTFPGLTAIEVGDPTQIVMAQDLPFMRFIDGTADQVIPWDLRPPVYQAFDASRLGAAIYWDSRGHTSGDGTTWNTAHFVGSPRHSVDWLTRYRRNQSFPAFHDVDHVVGFPGTQPDPGDAVLPANGDPFGTWGGWFDWLPNSVHDSARSWSVTLGLLTSSSFAADNAPLPTAEASVTIRRAQRFQPAPGTLLRWTFRRAGDGVLVASGLTVADADGLVTVPDLTFANEPMRLEVVGPVPQGTWVAW